jgi:hypothetical protein
MKYQNMKNETPKSHHEIKPPKIKKIQNPVHTELNSNHKYQTPKN